MNSTNQSSVSLKPNLLDRILNRFQAWAIENPQNFVSLTLLPIIGFLEGFLANFLFSYPVYLDMKKRKLGSTFCCAGQVVLADFKTIETNLTSPQARTWYLGISPLSARHCPQIDIGGRNVFLISLSDTGTEGNDHDAFRHCVEDYFFTDEMKVRQHDPVGRELLETLGADYRELASENRLEGFFIDENRGLMSFLIRYLHYVIFAIDPHDDSSIAALTNFHYTRRGTLHYFAASRILERFNLLGWSEIPGMIEAVGTIYEKSPVLANFQENNPKYNNMTRRELAKLMVALMSIAALQGPLHLGRTAMGYQSLPPYKGLKTSEIDVTAYWDRLDLDNPSSIKLFLLECGRLFTPVSASHRVATDSFTTTIAGKTRTFPPGTIILIPMILGMLTETVWGATPYEFQPQRENLCPYHMGFHSVGDRHAGRICPGKDLALETLTDVIRIVGKVRRSQLGLTSH
ncbi:unknown [Crocosphaera subtropica ATCC 51142]|uniref:Cytochrome P450 n=1 Tax=Crocosphaera subtropica (strain ATCC 51142 / BH68) TaxID=43989 RepID=B1WT75_CROS5|nr:hypothetical protein [Crocosphaera subtropica]ACB51997.1 unknown [Crocosphaera subtropica ATCC 51142]